MPPPPPPLKQLEWCNQVFLNFHFKSLVPTRTSGDNQKWSPQADLPIISKKVK